MKKLWWLLLLLTVLYWFGPKPSPAFYTTEVTKIEEDTSAGVKPGNHTLRIYTDSLKSKTRFCILYLHGFSASPMEGDPVMQSVARQFGMNLIAPRLYAHGLNNKEALLDFNSVPYWHSAAQNLFKAAEMGDSVIVMGTSTGATLALMLAAAFPDKVHGLVLYSPNIDLYDPRSFLLTAPWGLQIAQLVKGSKYHTFDGPEGTKKYWNTQYRLEALVELKNMLNCSMKKETFQKVSQPVLTLYYYKDDHHQDDVVSVKAIKEMHSTLKTPSKNKRIVAMPNAGVHALASGIWNHHTDEIINETSRFFQDVLFIDSQQ